MRLANEKLHEVIFFWNQFGDERTVQQFGIGHETLGRYKREYRIRFGSLGNDKAEFVSPKILVFDIETAPLEVYSWSLGKQHVNMEQIIKDWFIICWSAKWLNDNEVFCGAVTPAEALRRDDRRIIKDIWNFIEEADILISHNGENFDVPRLNTRFLLHGMNPPLSYQSIDTLKLARKKFAFTSNKLDYISRTLGLSGKIKVELDLWKEVVRGNPEAIEQMSIYNQRDVTLLEEVYLKLGSWMPSHPNLGVYIDDNHPMCPKCMSEDITWKGFYTTLVGRYSSFRCNQCGYIGRSRFNSLSSDKMKGLATSTAR